MDQVVQKCKFRLLATAFIMYTFAFILLTPCAYLLTPCAYSINPLRLFINSLRLFYALEIFIRKNSFLKILILNEPFIGFQHVIPFWKARIKGKMKCLNF